MKPKPTAKPAFGLIAWLEQTRVALPLKGVECRFDVTAGVASVELDQIYHQDAAQALDCTYTFPLPAGAAVYRCEVHVNGRVICARVESREEAQRTFQRHKEAGHRAALVEMERENLFTLSLGNVQPGDLVVVRFAWFQVLDRAGDTMRLSVPTCPGVRYIPGRPLLRGNSGKGTVDDTDQVPDASRITPPRMDALHPDAAYFSIQGRLSSLDIDGASLSSPTHAMRLNAKGDLWEVELASGQHVPDRDFVLAWRESEARSTGSYGWSWSDDVDTYALVQLRAPSRVEVADGYEQDVYFIVDRSGSMAGAKWTRTCEALRAFLELLGAEDRAWITVFSTDFRDFAEAPMLVPEVLRDPGFTRMEALGVGGGTELLPAATHVLKQIAEHSTGRRASVVLITDGQVGNEAEVLAAFRRAPEVRAHAFGIDTAVNDAFLQALANQQRGGCWLQTPDDDIRGTIASLADRLRRPVLTDLWIEGRWELAGRACPDLHGREVAVLPLRGISAEAVTIRALKPNCEEERFTIPLQTSSSEAIRLLWARERIAALLSEGKASEAIELAKESNLICEGAAFVAWDESEQVPIAREELVQPSMESFAAPFPGILMCKAMPAGDHMDLADADDHRSYAPLREEHKMERRRSSNEFTLSGGLTALRQRLTDAGVSDPAVERMVELLGKRMVGTVGGDVSPHVEAADLIRSFRRAASNPRLRISADISLMRAVSGTPEDLLKEGEAIRKLGVLARALNEKLPRAKSHQPLLVCILALVLEQRRIESLANFLKLLENLPFSEAAASRVWRQFLQTTIGADPEGQALLKAWEREIAQVDGVNVTV